MTDKRPHPAKAPKLSRSKKRPERKDFAGSAPFDTACGWSATGPTLQTARRARTSDHRRHHHRRRRFRLWGLSMGAMTVDPFEWQRHGAEWRLYRDRRVTGRVVADADYPGMWRVKLPGGLSDIANLTRARDAALGLAQRAESEKIAKRNQGPFSASAPPRRLNRRSLPRAPGPLNKRTDAA